MRRTTGSTRVSRLSVSYDYGQNEAGFIYLQPIQENEYSKCYRKVIKEKGGFDVTQVETSIFHMGIEIYFVHTSLVSAMKNCVTKFFVAPDI